MPHTSENHVIPILWQPTAATWKNKKQWKKLNQFTVVTAKWALYCTCCEATLICYYRLLLWDRQMLRNPFAWFNESIGENTVSNLGKRWEHEQRVKCQKGTGRTLHLYEMGVISLPEVITIAPLMEMHNYWKQLINCKSSRVARSSYLYHLLCLTQLEMLLLLHLYKRIGKRCCTFRHAGQCS